MHDLGADIDTYSNTDIFSRTGLKGTRSLLSTRNSEMGNVLGIWFCSC
jgi:hypothetical protein